MGLLDRVTVMRRLVVMAHYDAAGLVAPHVLRQVTALADVAERLIVVSTATLQSGARAALSARADLVTRPNVGYDFFSYRTGLDVAGDLSGYDQVIICNDSFVGPLTPYARILAAMDARDCDFWGMTQTDRRGRHAQSYFVAFRGACVRSAAFAAFWRAMEPVNDRAEVITRYELGLSRTLQDAGFRLGSYFTETPRDRRVARARHLWFAAQSLRRLPPHRRRRAVRRMPFEPWNPVSALADRALIDGPDGPRLPLVKIDTLRYDPYGLGAQRLLTACERRYPDAFAGVREFLARTSPAYPVRPGERTGEAVAPALVRHTIGYAR